MKRKLAATTHSAAMMAAEIDLSTARWPMATRISAATGTARLINNDSPILAMLFPRERSENMRKSQTLKGRTSESISHEYQ